VAAKTGVDLLLASRPDPEVVAKPKRRTYTAEYKLGILQESRGRRCYTRGYRLSAPPGRLVLVAAGHLEA